MTASEAARDHPELASPAATATQLLAQMGGNAAAEFFSLLLEPLRALNPREIIPSKSNSEPSTEQPVNTTYTLNPKPQTPKP